METVPQLLSRALVTNGLLTTQHTTESLLEVDDACSTSSKADSVCSHKCEKNEITFIVGQFCHTD